MTTKLRTVYNDGDFALHFDVKQLVAFDGETATVLISANEESLGAAPSRRVHSTREHFLAIFPVGGIHTAEQLGCEWGVSRYSKKWVQLDLGRLVEAMKERGKFPGERTEQQLLPF